MEEIFKIFRFGAEYSFWTVRWNLGNPNLVKCRRYAFPVLLVKGNMDERNEIGKDRIKVTSYALISEFAH